MTRNQFFQPAFGLYGLLLVVACIAALGIGFLPEKIYGDWQEYFLLAQAFSTHASPDIRFEDTVALAKSLPLPAYQAAVQAIGQGITDLAVFPAPGFVRVNNGAVYAIHFFGYSLMAAFIHVLTGLTFYKSFLVLNTLFVLTLAWAAHRLFGTTKPALATVVLFMVCGGAGYFPWPSPETVSAAGLLSALLLLHSGAVGRAAVFLGLAAMQNPTISLSFGVVPVFYLLAKHLGWIEQAPWRGVWRRPLSLAGLALGVAIALSPVAFNLWAFGTPNVIAKLATDQSLLSWSRLHSIYFDLNQGMVVNAAGLFAACAMVLYWQLTRTRVPVNNPSPLRYFPLAILLSIAMAVPTMAAQNWNSGSAGMMRYAFWALMPFVFAFLVAVHEIRTRRSVLFAVVFLIALLALPLGYPSGNLNHTQLVNWVFRKIPNLYNPEPEIFAERLLGKDGYLDTQRSYVVTNNGRPVKILVHPTNMNLDQQVCGTSGYVSSGVQHVNSSHGWKYLNAPILCEPGSRQTLWFDFASFAARDNNPLASGWSTPEGADVTDRPGVWSVGEHSTLKLDLKSAQTIDSVTLFGHYYGSNRETRVTINGVDFGLVSLNTSSSRIDVGSRLRQPVATLTIELAHQKPESPLSNGATDPRMLALFLHSAGVQFH